MRLPDGARSRAVLIGTSTFAEPDLPDLPAVRNNLTSLAEVLTSPSETGLPAEHCSILLDVSDDKAIGAQLEAYAKQAEDLMLVYYAGHGLIDSNARLNLALPGTELELLRWSALKFDQVREVLHECRAANCVLILDCCFSGRAIETMSEPVSVATAQIEIEGTYTLTATPPNAAASAPAGEKYTAFTGALLDILHNGIVRGPKLLSFHAVYPDLNRRLRARGLDGPVQRGVRTADQLALAPNHAYDPAEPGGNEQATGSLNDDELKLLNSDRYQDIADWARDRLRAGRIVLRLSADMLVPRQTFVSGKPLPAELDRIGPTADPMLRMRDSQVRQFRRSDATPDIHQSLFARGVDEALVVSLRSATHLLGFVEVHGNEHEFDQADLTMLGMIASQLTSAIDNRRLLARLHHDAYHDPLTGLLNRPGLVQAAGEHLRKHPGSVLLRVDLEVLPAIGDALGYVWSDRMVIIASSRLRDVLGSEVPLARLERGEFAALLGGVTLEQVHATAETLCVELSAPYPMDRFTIEAASFAGYASSGDQNVDTLLQRADLALRAARSGGDKVRGYVPSMGKIFLRRFQLVSQFRGALETGQVKLHYQPKVALPSRQVLGVEALVRWRHPEFGPLHPDEFVPAIEAAGLVDVLFDFVLDQALVRVRKWMDQGLRLSAAVNLSPRSLINATFQDRVAARLNQCRVPVELLTLELSESGVMADPQRALPVLRQLHALGVGLAVDDFGTGYSSLAYLRQLPLDEVKIDKSFVLGMGSDLGDLAVVRSIVELGHSLGLAVVADGVEEEVARDQLVAMGCDVAQGYLYSRPLSEARFEAWLQARTVPSQGPRGETVRTLI